VTDGVRFPLRNCLIVAVADLKLKGGIVLAMGRVPICNWGTIKLWTGAVTSAENSQQILDWYTFSHIIHGFIFYGLTWLIFPRAGLFLRFTLALMIEGGWEILENSPIIIDRYRAGTISLNYYGDSVINSLFDSISMMTGFMLAWRLPVWAVVGLAVVMELFVGYWVRDNLTLNIIMLIHPSDAIRTWQSGA
jgi:hypothetical protein